MTWNDEYRELAQLAQSTLSERLIGEEDSRGQQSMRCPVPSHEDSHKSATVNWQKGVWFCQVCRPSGKEATVRGLLESLGVETPRSRQKATWNEERGLPLPEACQRWHGDLMGNPEILEYLKTTRMLDTSIIRQAGIGWCGTRNWLTIPLHGENGDLVRVKYRHCEEDGTFANVSDKYRYFPDRGLNPPTVYPLSLFRGDDATVYVTAGELDSLVLHQHGVNAICSTRGETAFPKELLAALRGKHVVLCLDADEPGQAASWELARHTFSTSASVRILDFPEGIKDITDFFRMEDATSFDALALQSMVYEPSSVDPTFGLYADRDCYLVASKNRTKVLSSFILQPKRLLSPLDRDLEDVIEASCRTRSGKTMELTLPKSAFDSKNAFQKELRESTAQWYGSDDLTKALLLHLVESDVPQANYVNKLGWYRHEEGGTSVVTRDGFVGKPLRWWNESRSAYFNFDVAEEADHAQLCKDTERITENFMRAAAPNIILPLLGWYHAAFFAPYFREQLHHFPVLCCVGTAGSGKTETNYYIMARMVGLSTPPMSSVHRTPHSLRSLFNQSSSFPVILDEFTPQKFHSDRTQFIIAAMHHTYDGAVEELGRADLSLVRYDYAAPLVILGEQNKVIEQEALKERTIFVQFPAAETRQSDDAAYMALGEYNWRNYARCWYEYSLGVNLHPFLKEAQVLSRPFRKLPRRMYDNITVTTAGFLMWRAFMGEHGFEPDINAWKNAFGQDQLQEPMRLCDEFLIDIDAMILHGELTAGKDYRIDEDVTPRRLLLHLSSCHNAWEQHRRRRNDDVADRRSIRRQLAERLRRYVIDMDCVARLGYNEKPVRCVMIDLEKLSSYLGEHLNALSATKRGEEEVATKVEPPKAQAEEEAAEDPDLLPF